MELSNQQSKQSICFFLLIPTDIVSYVHVTVKFSEDSSLFYHLYALSMRKSFKPHAQMKKIEKLECVYRII